VAYLELKGKHETSKKSLVSAHPVHENRLVRDLGTYFELKMVGTMAHTIDSITNKHTESKK